MRREIVELDDLLLIDAEHVAKQNGKTLSEFMSDALRYYVAASRKPTRLTLRSDDAPSQPVAGEDGLPRLSLIGLIDVPTTWTQEELDRELMDGLDPREGWSHDTPTSETSEISKETRAS